MHTRYTGTTTLGWMTIKIPNQKYQDFNKNSVECVEQLSSPRFLKTHLPFHLLPRQLRTREKKNKIIYVTRNPKDTCISYFHHYKLFEAYCGTFEDFCKLFLGNKVYYASYWNHIIGYLKNDGDKDILFLKYEDMKKDLSSVIRRTATFLNKNLEYQQIKDLETHLSFTSMKKNPAVNRECYAEWVNSNKFYGENVTVDGQFIRKGEVGQWKSTMTNDLVKQFDDWTDKNLRNLEKIRNEFQ